MKIEKAYFGVEGERVSLSVPLAKVDAENRIVSGFATLDNVDTQDDVVTAEASIAAFKRSKARLREMHDKVAVGKIVSFKEDEFYDQETEKFYRGVYVDAYVSKGAPNTWEKVLDGTLAAFSIGGAIKQSESQIVKDATGANKPVRVIKDYDLTELSLVDSGANQLANIFSITKMADGNTSVDGIATDVIIENVFYCNTDKIAKSITAEEAECSNCHQVMKNIGFIEVLDDRDKAVKELVDKVITTKDINDNERSEHMADKKETTEEKPVETEDTSKAENVTEDKKDETVDHGEHEDVTVNSASVDDIEGAPEAVKEAEKAEEEEPKEDDKDVAKMIGDLSEQIKTSFAKSEEKLLTEIDTKLAKSAGELETKIQSLETKHQELVEKFNSLNTAADEVEKRLGSVEAGTAIRKSNDLGRSTEDNKIVKKKESLWGGTFLGTDSL